MKIHARRLAGLMAVAVLCVGWTAWVSPIIAQSPPGTLLQASNLTYLGAFKVPQDIVNGAIFQFGGMTPAYNPANNSLFLMGRNGDTPNVAEISIPTPVNGTLDSMNTAQWLQPFVEPTEGARTQVNPDPAAILGLGGLFVSNGLLYGTVYDFYDAAGTVTRSHFSRPLNLSTTGQVRGIFTAVSSPVIAADSSSLGPHAAPGYVAGWVGSIPAAWQGALGGEAFSGLCCVSIISRTSYGQALFSWHPSQLATTDPVAGSVTFTPLAYYNIDHPEPGRSTYEVFKGAVFPNGSRTVMFLGWKGTGPWWYGANDLTNPGHCPTDFASLEGQCWDPVFPDQGDHEYPYVAEWRFVDANDLAAVKNGTKNPWDVTPYATVPFVTPAGNQSFQIQGAAYDPAAQRIYVSLLYGDDNQFPLIHVFQITGLAGGAPPPAAPGTAIVTH